MTPSLSDITHVYDINNLVSLCTHGDLGGLGWG